MKKILVLGAGKSSPYLISWLLNHAEDYDWSVIVADYDLNIAKSRVGDHPRGKVLKFDADDSDALQKSVKEADLVMHILAPKYQYDVGLTCVKYGKHMISVSYEDKLLKETEPDAIKNGVLILTEIGLDPGIDHMAAAELTQKIREKGGIIESFESYGGGLPAPDSLINPFKYVITWNPRNVVMAGEKGAQYLEKGKIKIIPWHQVFRRTRDLEIEGLGTMEIYPNRDSLSYRSQYGFEDAETVIRGTIRYPGWCETWFHLIRLGWPNETLQIPDLQNRTYAQVTEMFLPVNLSADSLEKRVAAYLDINPAGEVMEKFRWLGIFSDQKINQPLNTSAEVLTHLINDKLRLTDDVRDMVILFHRLKVRYPGENNRREEITSTMTDYGDRGRFTAMAKTVGLPAAIAAKLILTDSLSLTGCRIPTHPQIYKPILKELAEAGIVFKETVSQV